MQPRLDLEFIISCLEASQGQKLQVHPTMLTYFVCNKPLTDKLIHALYAQPFGELVVTSSRLTVVIWLMPYLSSNNLQFPGEGRHPHKHSTQRRFRAFWTEHVVTSIHTIHLSAALHSKYSPFFPLPFCFLVDSLLLSCKLGTGIWTLGLDRCKIPLFSQDFELCFRQTKKGFRNLLGSDA